MEEKEDIFINKIERKKFQSTNTVWNLEALNTPWSLGYVSNLIESKNFETKEEWIAFYYESGKDRLELMKKLSLKEQFLLQSYGTVDKKTQEEINSLSLKAKCLNFNYGRTEFEIREKGVRLFEAMQEAGNQLNVSLEECVYMAKFRTIGDTYNGIVAREKNTIARLQNRYPELVFRKASGANDFKYGIDYEVIKEDKLVGAIQIKPASYKESTIRGVMNAKNINNKKNEEFFKKFGLNISYIYSKKNGELLNPEEVNFLDVAKFF